MIARSVILLLALVIWGAGLQFAIRPTVSSMLPGLALVIHILPPLMLWAGWLVMRWRISELRQKEAERHAAEDESRREAERAAARLRHEEELQLRRFHCDCRALAISVAQTQALALADAMPPNANIDVLDDCAPRDAASMHRLRPFIENALGYIYSTSPAAALLPVYVQLPSDIPGNEVLDLLRTIRTELAESVGIHTVYAAPILFLSAVGATCDSVLALFENAPDLPGAVVLAFDSPQVRSYAEQNDSETPRYQHQYPAGFPNEGAVALLVTNTGLARMLDDVSRFDPASLEGDALKPFWERSPIPEGLSPLLVRMDRALRTELGLLPIIGCIHRASVGEPKGERTGTLEMTRMLQSLLEHVQVDAGLIDKPFILESADRTDIETPPQQLQCARLVHNAGNAGAGGKRLAALGSAMLYFGIDFSPVDPEFATNASSCFGNLGCATGIAQLAIGIAHASGSAAPALCAEFTGRDSVALSIVMPAAASA